MMPLIEDFKHLFDDIGFYLGMRKRKAYYGRYNYAEKVEYLAVVWGTLVMGISGFMMWNPISTANWLPGGVIPAAKAAHGAEAILAVAAIIIWHFYHVHLRHFNKSMFTGKLTRDEMKHEHPAELAAIEAGKSWKHPPTRVLRKRQRVFFPFAFTLAIIFSFGAYKFVTFEETAITTVPQGDTA
jgi:cytochrome b subunit of formate dehydrogenase